MATKNAYSDMLAFINTAISTDETRYSLCAAYFDAEKMRIVSTDGRRLHVLQLDEADLANLHLAGVPSGYVKLVPKEGLVIPFKLEGQFPNYEKVIPDYVKREDNSGVVNFDGPMNLNKNTSIFIARTQIAIDYTYLKGLYGHKWEYLYSDTTAQVSVGYPKEKAAMYPEYRQKAVIFTCGKMTAAIMPMQCDATPD